MFQNVDGGIVQCGRRFNEEELELIRETVELFPRLSLTELAYTICENLGWFTASGNYKGDACVKLLRKLEARGELKLPKKRGYTGPERVSIRLTKRSAAGQPIGGRLKEVGPISLEAALGKQAIGLCREYLFRYHYLGYKKPFGCYLYYLVHSTKGVLGCALFSGAAKGTWGKGPVDWVDG